MGNTDDRLLVLYAQPKGVQQFLKLVCEDLVAEVAVTFAARFTSFGITLNVLYRAEE